MRSGSVEQRPRTPTIRDVARRAGVGVGTVSRVLNDSPSVTKATHARVIKAIDQLGYRRSSTARSLSLGRSHAVGVVAPFFTSPSVVERLRGVVERLAERGYSLVLFSIETPQQESITLQELARQRVDGLLVISLPLSPDELAALRRDDLPVVMVDVGHDELPHVVIDDVRGGELATEHLIEKGHERIGFVGDVPTNPFGFTSSERRRKGFKRVIRRKRIRAANAPEALGGYGRVEARRLAEELLSADDPPTAVFAASDMQAIGVLETAGSMGLRVPDDLAVIGFDDIEMAGVIGLTTVRQPLYETGARGADLLLAAIEGEADSALEELKPLVVIERDTT
jgi:LacI family transcriptional regulator/LacI family repressor for deo operon, udp, cdd, tsx, nupC, and nupG